MPNQNIKILFFGTSDFAIPILQKLIDAKYNISAVVTQPDKPVGRKQILTPSPVKILAQKYGILIQQPEKLSLKSITLSGDSSPRSSAQNDTLIITASYGKIIPKKILDLPEYGALNVHPSLLPKYRGPSPIQYAILNGDKETGVTIMLMDEKMDHGPILAQEHYDLTLKTSPSPPPQRRGNETSRPFEGSVGAGFKNLSQTQNIMNHSFSVLHDTLSQLGADLLLKTIPKWISGEIKPVPQDEVGARHCLVPTYTEIITKENGKIDWKKSAIEIERQIRAFTPWPGCWTIMNIGGKEKRVKIIEAIANNSLISPLEGGKGGVELGQVIATQTKPLIIKLPNKKMAVACGAGHLEILKLQPEGKKEMSGKEFLRGYGDVEKFI